MLEISQILGYTMDSGLDTLDFLNAFDTLDTPNSVCTLGLLNILNTWDTLDSVFFGCYGYPDFDTLDILNASEQFGLRSLNHIWCLGYLTNIISDSVFLECYGYPDPVFDTLNTSNCSSTLALLYILISSCTSGGYLDFHNPLIALLKMLLLYNFS